MALELVPGALAEVNGRVRVRPPVRGGVVTRIFDAEETASRLPYPELADSIREVALAMSSGELQAPPRLVLSLTEGGVLLVMPASDQEIAITKLVTVHPENPGRGLPTIQGEVVVMKAATGERLGLLEGSVVTARRTAALSMLAARELAPRPDGPLLVVGAGTQGRSHLEAFREGLGVSEVFTSSRTADSATSLAEHAQDLGMDAEAVERPEEVLEEVSLVVTATTSREPVLPDEVPHGTFVAAVGSFEPEAAELPQALISTSTGLRGHDGRREGGGWRPHPGCAGRRLPVGGRDGAGGRAPLVLASGRYGRIQERGACSMGPRRRQNGFRRPARKRYLVEKIEERSLRETFWLRCRRIVRSTRVEQTIGSRLIALCLISLAMLASTCSVALAQGTDTVYDEARCPHRLPGAEGPGGLRLGAGGSRAAHLRLPGTGHWSKHHASQERPPYAGGPRGRRTARRRRHHGSPEGPLGRGG